MKSLCTRNESEVENLELEINDMSRQLKEQNFQRIQLESQVVFYRNQTNSLTGEHNMDKERFMQFHEEMENIRLELKAVTTEKCELLVQSDNAKIENEMIKVRDMFG